MEDNQDMAAAIAFTKAMINGIPALVSNAASIDGRTHVEIALRLPSLPGASLQPQIEDLAKRSWNAKPSPAKRSKKSWPQVFRLRCRRPVRSLEALRLPSHIQCHNDDPQEGSFLALQGTPGALKRLRGMIQKGALSTIICTTLFAIIVPIIILNSNSLFAPGVFNL